MKFFTEFLLYNFLIIDDTIIQKLLKETLTDEKQYSKKMKKLEKRAEKLKIQDETNGYDDPYAHLYETDNNT